MFIGKFVSSEASFNINSAFSFKSSASNKHANAPKNPNGLIKIPIGTKTIPPNQIRLFPASLSIFAFDKLLFAFTSAISNGQLVLGLEDFSSKLSAFFVVSLTNLCVLVNTV